MSNSCVGILRGGRESVFTLLPLLTTVYKLKINQQNIINILLVYHEHINISNITSTSQQVHSTPKFMWKPKWEKTTELFLIYQRIHSLEAPTSQFSSCN
jgi:hypothetical protein